MSFENGPLLKGKFPDAPYLGKPDGNTEKGVVAIDNISCF
jgi:hypothetical protein